MQSEAGAGARAGAEAGEVVFGSKGQGLGYKHDTMACSSVVVCRKNLSVAAAVAATASGEEDDDDAADSDGERSPITVPHERGCNNTEASSSANSLSKYMQLWVISHGKHERNFTQSTQHPHPRR